MNYPKTISLINAKNKILLDSTKKWILITLLSIFSTFVFLLSFSIHDILTIYTQKNEITTLKNKLHALQPLHEKYQMLIKQKDTITAHEKKITHYQNHENRPIHLLNMFLQLSSHEFLYQQLQINKKSLAINIAQIDIPQLHMFIAQLNAQEIIKNVHIKSIAYDTDSKKYTCSLACTIST